jgi:hypothetical protein
MNSQAFPNITWKININLKWKFSSTMQQANSFWVIKTSQLRPCTEIKAASSEIHTKHIHTLCGQELECFNVKPGGTQNNDWALKRLKDFQKTSDSCSVVSHLTLSSRPTYPAKGNDGLILQLPVYYSKWIARSPEAYNIFYQLLN